MQTSDRIKSRLKVIQGFEYAFPDQSGFGSGCVPDRCRNIMDSLAGRRQSLRRVSYDML